MGRFDGDPEGGDGGMAHQRRIRSPAKAAKTPMWRALATQKRRKTAQPATLAEAAVEGEHELDPVADAEPVDHAGGPAQQEAARPARFASEGDEQRGEGDGRQPDEVKISGKTRIRSAAEASGQNPVQHETPLGFLADQVGHVGTAHERSAEDGLEAEARDRNRARRRTAAGSTKASTGRLRRVGWRYCPMVAIWVPAARRSRSRVSTSAAVSPRPTMKPDLVSTERGVSAARTRGRRGTAGSPPADARGHRGAARFPYCD